MGVYDTHLENKKRVESERRAAKENHRGKKAERHAWRNKTAVTVALNSEKFREGWDRIFGKKQDD